MGTFLAGPFVDGLKDCAEGGNGHPAHALSDGRRVMEVLVPLAYRPAMKA
jgi:hypothetical protein